MLPVQFFLMSPLVLRLASAGVIECNLQLRFILAYVKNTVL
jgi:hypothetical protein